MNELKKRKLLGNSFIKCPDNHQSFCNVYEDNGFEYYICGYCGLVVGLENVGFLNKGIGFTGPNCSEIMKLFETRSQNNGANCEENDEN